MPGRHGTAGLLASVLAIPGQPEHVQAARAFTGLVLGMHAIDDEGVAALLVSELVTNSLSHSDSGKPGRTITVTVSVGPEMILAEVADDGGNAESALSERIPRERPGDDSEHGRGLLLVDELADAWGYFGGAGGLVAWFELKIPPRPSAIPARAPARPAR
jgi:anti-sigma regulatory factor (Ser/Thr protein kinase)